MIDLFSRNQTQRHVFFQCVCDGPVTIQVLTTAPDGTTPITSLEQAISLTPEGCILTSPDDAILTAYPFSGPTAAILPIVKDVSLAAEPCTAGVDCASDYFYLDGTPVPATVGGAMVF